MPLIQSSLSDGVGTIAFDNYAHRNALSAALIAEAIAAFAAMHDDARVVVLRAASKNKVWSAGHDLSELSPKGQDPLAWRDPLEQLLRVVGAFPGPVIAMIDGSVWGGACDLALDCDITLGDADAMFRLCARQDRPAVQSVGGTALHRAPTSQRSDGNGRDRRPD